MNVRKRGLALLMCICMIFTLLPFSALADETAKVLYVDANKGNDTTGDGTKENPCKTVGKALEQTDNNGTYTIYLGAGEYSSYETKVAEGKNLTLTFIGDSTGTTVYKMGTSEAGKNGEDGDYSLQGNNKVTFEKMTLLSSVTPSGKMVTRNYTGFIRIQHIVVNNCVVEGRATYWGYTVTEFNNTTFYAPGHEALNSELLLGADNKTDYSLWTGTGTNYTFNHCIFNSNGKSILVYRDGTELNKNVTINIQDCTVVSSAPSKSVMNIDDSNMGSFKYTLNITGNNVVKGLDASSITCSRLFGFSSKANNTGKTDVNFGETTVWKDGKMVDADAYHTSGVMAEGVSYTNGVEGSNNSLYTDGYKDNAFTVEKNGNTVTKTCKYCGWKETKQDWNINVSKTATNLKKDANGDYKTNVTLSVPGVEENLATDVLLVLDSSRCSKDMLLATVNLLDNLAKQAENGANIKLGIVMFKGNAVPFKTFDSEKSIADIRDELSALVVADDPEGKLTKAAVRKYIAESCPQIMNSGTNIPAGLQLAKNMLAADTSVADSRKYMVFVSDGNTYLFCHENADGTGYDYTKAWSRTGPTTKQLGGIAEYENWDQDSEAMAQFNYAKGTSHDWTNYIAAVKANNDRFTKYDYEVAVAGEIPEGAPVIPETDTNRVVNSDVSRYQTATLYKELISKYNCYYCALPEGGYILARPMLCDLTPADHLIDGTNIDTNIFSGITKDMFFAVGAGSTIEDTIGKDFTLDTESIKLTVGKTEYVAAKTDSVEGTIKYNFSKTSDADPTFSLVYTVNSKTFTLNIGEDISYAAPVQLSYTLKLTTPETKPGTYGQLDLKGDGYIDGKDTETKVDPNKALNTNNNATQIGRAHV